MISITCRAVAARRCFSWTICHNSCGLEGNFHRTALWRTACYIKQPAVLPRTLPSHRLTLHRLYRSTNCQRKGKEKKESDPEKSENIDDLKSLLQNKSLSFTAKFKVLFQQYGVVLVVVHCITAAFWFGLFYYAVSRGFDIVPFMERHGVFDFLEKIGLPASDKLKSPGASNALAAYLLYEVAKPIRYPVTIIGTIYAVRFLRRLGHLKRPPTTNTTVRELVQTQSKIMQHHVRSTATKYRDHYKIPKLRQSGKKKHHGGAHSHHHRNGTRKKIH